MGQDNAVPRRINRVEGVLGQVMKSGGAGVVEAWGYDDYGLSFEGTVTGIAGAPNFQCSGLTGFGDAYFEDYFAYVIWDAGGAGGAPQGEYLEVTGYSSATGDFTVAAFTVAIGVGDKVLIIHPSIARILDTYAAVGAIEGATTLHNKLTAARAALLDEITAVRLAELDAANIPADVDGLKTSRDRQLFPMDFWSNPVKEKVVTNAQVTAAVGGVVVVHDLPAGATVVIAKVMFKYRMVENTNVAENSLDLTAIQPIQVDDSGNTGWVTAIDFVDEQYEIAAETREGGDVLIGDNNVAARVDGNDTYDFQWLNAKAHLADIKFSGLQMGIKIWYSV